MILSILFSSNMQTTVELNKDLLSEFLQHKDPSGYKHTLEIYPDKIKVDLPRKTYEEFKIFVKTMENNKSISYMTEEEYHENSLNKTVKTESNSCWC
jgi:hypothetical protein